MRGARRLYRLILRMHPEPIRRRHGEDMERWFLRGLDRHRARGRAAAAAYLLRVVADAAASGAGARLRRAGAGRLRADAGSAARAFRRRPRWALLLAFTVALPSAAITAAWAVVDAALLTPLPFPEPERLVVVYPSLPSQGMEKGRVTGTELLAVREEVPSLTAVGGAWSRFGILGGDEGPEHVDLVWTAGAFFETLGASAHVGRLPGAEDDVPGAPPVMALGHDLWVRRYGGDPSVVGRSVLFDGEPRTIVGVLPEGFRPHLPPGALVTDDVDVWAPWRGRYAEQPQAWRFFTLVGRLAPGATLERVRDELARAADALEARHQEYGDGDLVLDAEPLREDVVRSVRAPLFGLLAAAVACLLVACVNVASLLGVSIGERRREFAVRRALGAGRGDLVRQVLAETLGVVGAGFAAGLAGAVPLLEAFQRLRPDGLHLLAPPRLTPSVAALTALAVGAAGLGFALAPALRAGARPDGGRGATADPRLQRLRGALVSGQFALCFLLVLGSLLLLRSFDALRDEDLGFRAEGVLTARTSLPSPRYPYAEPEPISGFWEELVASAARHPGVSAAGATLLRPLETPVDDTEPVAWIDAAGEEVPWGTLGTHLSVTTAGWFEAVGAELLAGRLFDAGDGLDAPLVAIVDERLARRAWPGEDAVGRRVRVNLFLRATTEPAWATVVGVVRTVKLTDAAAADPPQVWLHHLQSPRRSLTLALRTDAAAADVAGLLRADLRRLDPGMALFDVRPLEAFVDASLATARFLLALIAAFALLTATLATAGIHGLARHVVDSGRREMGVRIALGAAPSSVARSVVGAGMRRVAVGVAAGGLAAAALAPALGTLLHGVSPLDPLSLGGAAAALTAVALAALVAPARRALRTEPSKVLREG